MRFHFIDGLRGIAALMVMLFHFYSLINKNTGANLPLDFVFLKGHLGVQIFFVLSGFVIAYSIRHASLDLQFGTRFFLRRSLRLDPPYWIALLTMVFLSATSALLLKKEIPFSTSTLFANIFYVQDFLGYERLLPVSWTLCIELQFYLFLVGLLILFKNTKGFFITLFVLSIDQSGPQVFFDRIDGLFLPYWYSFFIGCTLAWVYLQKIERKIFFIYLAGMLPLLYNLQAWMTAFTALAIFSAIHFDTLTKWLSAPLFGYFGSRSYSLYLIHWLVGMKGLDIASRWLPGLPAPLLFLAAALLTLLGTELFYRKIERPSLELSHSIKTKCSTILAFSFGCSGQESPNDAC